MKNLEAIEKRYLAGSPAKEDIPDLIAEVRRLQNQGTKAPAAKAESPIAAVDMPRSVEDVATRR